MAKSQAQQMWAITDARGSWFWGISHTRTEAIRRVFDLPRISYRGLEPNEIRRWRRWKRDGYRVVKVLVTLQEARDDDELAR